LGENQTQANKKKAELLIRRMFDIINYIKSDNVLISYVLAHLDGILEESRSRIKFYIATMDDFKSPYNLIDILNSFIHRNSIKDFMQRDCATHILALLIDASDYNKYHKQAQEFLLWLEHQTLDTMTISVNAYTFALMTLLKSNEIARIFCIDSSFRMIVRFLDGPCL